MADAPLPEERPRFPLLARTAPAVLGALLAVVLAFLAHSPFRSFDTFFHLRFGAEFRGAWPIADPGHPSVASSNDWLPTQWLPQVLLATVADAAGSTGLVVALASLLALLGAAVYALLRSRTTPGVAALLTAVVIVGLLPSLSLRPQLVSFLLAVVVVASWDHARRTGRTPWWLVPLSWLWAVSHGMWILGIVMSGVLAVAVGVERRAGVAAWLRLIAVPAGMLLAACVTPVGPRLVSSVLLVNARAEHFREWAAPELTTPALAPLTALLAVSVLLAALGDRARPFEVALLALGGVFAVYSQRTVPLALVVLAALVASQVSALRELRGRRRRRVRRIETAVVAALAVAVVVLAPLLPEAGASEDRSAVAAFDHRLKALPEATMVLTDRRYGSVLLWTHPHLDVPIHGYGDVYTDAELETYDDLAELEPGWDETLRDLGVEVALLSEDDRLAYALEQRGWAVSDRGEGLLLLTAAAGAR